MVKGGGSMLKTRLITLALTVAASPFAFVLAKLALGTKIGGMSDGGGYMN
jgi:hypothetical protein